MRAAAVEGKLEYTEELEQSLEALAKAWLKPCDLAERLITARQERNFEPDNLTEFRYCCKEMRAIVEFNESWQNESLPPGLAKLRDEALAEHRNGETAEFFPETEPHEP